MKRSRLLKFVPEKQTEAKELSSPGSTSITLTWLEEHLDACSNLDLPLARYVVSTQQRVSSSEVPKAKECDRFRCPPPYDWHCDKGGKCSSSRRKRSRFRKKRVCELWTNFIIAALSHHACGLQVAPLRGREGVPLTGAQNGLRDRCFKMISSVVRLPQDEGGCGLRLPAAGTRFLDLQEQLSDLGNLPSARAAREFQGIRSADGFTATQALPVIAERLSLPDEVSDFDPRPYLSPVFKEIYEDPDKFLKAPEDMPQNLRAKGTATRSELLKVFGRWDKLDRLFVCNVSDVNLSDRCELFAVAKDAHEDRQILHRRKRNQREVHVQGASQDLPHGVLLTQLHGLCVFC